MTKKYSAGRQYIRQARYRLLNNGYADYFLERKASMCINNKKLTVSQYEDMCRKIKEISACDEFVYDTLDKLVPDRIEFNNLDETTKVRYMLELSRIYKIIKKDYYIK